MSDELPEDQNIYTSEVTDPNNINNINDYQAEEQEHISSNIMLQSKDNQIKQLKRKIEAYEKNAEEQNQKLSDYDHLLVEYNSINKNYSQMQQDLDLIKAENMQLKDIINSKNQTIVDFQNLFEASKSKFELFNQTNTSLKSRIAELESKLKTVNLDSNNEEIKGKLSDYETKIEQMTQEFNNKEDLYKIKINNMEKLLKSNTTNYEEEKSELNNEINKLKNMNDTLKKKNEEITKKNKNTEEQ